MKTDEERRQYAREYYLRNRAAFADRNARRDKAERNRRLRERYASDPEFREKCLRYKKDPDKDRDRKLQKSYGLTLSEYQKMLESQGGVCAICGDPPKGRFRLAVDHCHSTGLIRGLLCDRCNHGLGHFKDDVVRLKRAIDYLSKVSE